jgi:hypothetical protein
MGTASNGLGKMTAVCVPVECLPHSFLLLQYKMAVGGKGGFWWKQPSQKQNAIQSE